MHRKISIYKNVARACLRLTGTCQTRQQTPPRCGAKTLSIPTNYTMVALKHQLNAVFTLLSNLNIA